MTARVLAGVCFALVFMVGSTGLAQEKAAAQTADDVKSQADVDKDTVLKWLDAYRKKQVLFHDEDIARLRKDLADDTADEARRWWARTAEIRAALDSTEWELTREWLREFLRVQAIYSDQEIDEFRNEATTTVQEGTPKEFKEILADIERRRTRLRQGSANARELRESQLEVVQAFRKEEASARLAADRSRAAAAASFNTNTAGQQNVRPRAPRYSRPPIVTSLDAARWSVMRGFWRY